MGIVFNSATSKSSTFVFKLLKLVGILTNLLMSSLSISVFKTIKSIKIKIKTIKTINSKVPTIVACPNSF